MHKQCVSGLSSGQRGLGPGTIFPRLKPHSHAQASFPGSSLIPRPKPHSQAGVSFPCSSLIPRLKSHSQAQATFPGSSLIPRLKPHFQAQVSFPRLNLGMRLGTLLMMVSRSMKNGVASSLDPFPLLRRGLVHTVCVLYIPSFRKFVK